MKRRYVTKIFELQCLVLKNTTMKRYISQPCSAFRNIIAQMGHLRTIKMALPAHPLPLFGESHNADCVMFLNDCQDGPWSQLSGIGHSTCYCLNFFLDLDICSALGTRLFGLGHSNSIIIKMISRHVLLKLFRFFDEDQDSSFIECTKSWITATKQNWDLPWPMYQPRHIGHHQRLQKATLDGFCSLQALGPLGASRSICEVG